jgi:pyruvate ferredoxin oxidoreductase alpha subunit
MAEVVYIAASMRAPVVMALGNRALSGPINIHCDHSDSMLIRDSGAIQIFAESAQEAYDMTVLAPRLAEHPDVLLPVIVCVDGFTITHSAEPVLLLDDEQVREFVGEYRIPHPLLDLANPTTQGPFAMPDYYYELRRQQAAAIEGSLPVFEELGAELGALTGRMLGGLEEYRIEEAERVLVCLGSTAGTVKDVVDELRDDGEAVGLLRICSYRPFPAAEIRESLAQASEIIVLDRADSPGGFPPLAVEVIAAAGPVRSHVYGLGGREIHPADLREVFAGTAPHYVGLRSEACPV